MAGCAPPLSRYRLRANDRAQQGQWGSKRQGARARTGGRASPLLLPSLCTNRGAHDWEGGFAAVRRRTLAPPPSRAQAGAQEGQRPRCAPVSSRMLPPSIRAPPSAPLGAPPLAHSLTHAPGHRGGCASLPPAPPGLRQPYPAPLCRQARRAGGRARPLARVAPPTTSLTCPSLLRASRACRRPPLGASWGRTTCPPTPRLRQPHLSLLCARLARRRVSPPAGLCPRTGPPAPPARTSACPCMHKGYAAAWAGCRGDSDGARGYASRVVRGGEGNNGAKGGYVSLLARDRWGGNCRQTGGSG